MSRLRFKTDWVDPAGVQGPELAATMATLEIRVDDSVVSRVLDTRAQTVHDSVCVPLYPFAEWMATNWWFLTHETNSPARSRDPDFRRRHAIGDRDGYSYPSLHVFPQGDRTHLVWKPDRSRLSSVEFLDGGSAWIGSGEFRDTCSDLIDRVIRRLLSLGVEGTLLQEEWLAIQGADREEVEFCIAAAQLGWDPYDLDDDQSAFVLRLDSAAGATKQP